MVEILTVAIGIGLAVSLLFSELFGLAAGGMVVPGYFALFLDQPVNIILTLLASLATYSVVHLLSTFVIVYGRRRTVLMILVGYIVRLLFEFLPLEMLQSIELLAKDQPTDVLVPVYQVIGYIIPGLIAIWIDRQGLVETLSALMAASVAIRLILILIYGVDLHVML